MYDKAMECNSDNALALAFKAYVIDSQGLKMEAKNLRDLALKCTTKDADNLRGKGLALSALGDKAGATKCYDEALAINPEDALYHCSKGKALFNLGREAEALECFNKAAVIAESGNLGSNLSEGNKNYINKVLNEDRTSLIKKLTEFASIKVETLEVTSENEGFISEKLKLKKQGSISKSKRLKLLQKELISEAVDALDSKNNITAAQFAEIFRQLEEGKKEKLAYNEEIRLLRAELEAVKTTVVSKADKSEVYNLETKVSHAIKINETEETKAKQMQEINAHINLVDYYDGFVFTFSQSYTTSQAILSGKLSLDTGNIGVTLASQALSLIPFCGSVVGAGVQAVGDFIISARFTKSASKFAKLASNHTELDKIVEKVAREVVLHIEKNLF
jgi:tetratricopeptide (TPR) repeat protein